MNKFIKLLFETKIPIPFLGVMGRPFRPIVHTAYNLLHVLFPGSKKLPKYLQRTLATMMIFVTLLTSGTTLYLLAPLFSKPAEAAWFDDTWVYREEIPITSTNGSAQSNVFVSFSLDTASLISSKLQSSCQDIRITDQGGKLLKYHIGRTNACNASNTTIDFLIPSFPDGKSTYYVYYGNPSAVSKDAGAFSQSEASNYSVGSLGSEKKASDVGNTQGPVAYWAFNLGTGTTAKNGTSQGSTLDGTLAGSTLPVWKTEDQCISGKCLYFDGSSSKVTVGNAIKGVMSISMWIYPNSVSSSALIDLDGGTHTITVSSGAVTAGGFTSPTYYVNGVSTTSPVLIANRWNFLTVTTGTSFDSTSSFTLANSSSTYLKGIIDEVKIYNYARSAAQVKIGYDQYSGTVFGSNIQNQPAALSDGLMGYYKLDESTWDGTSGEIKDASGNALNGRSRCTPATCSVPTTGVGKFSNGGVFDGTDDYLDMGTSNVLTQAQTDLSGAAWFKTSVTDSSSQWVFGDMSSIAGYRIRVVSNTVKAQLRYDNATLSTEITSGSGYADGNWHHAAFTYKSSTGLFSLYVDGSLVTTSTYTSGIASSANSFTIGKVTNFAGTFNGSIDEVRVYNRTLSAADISTLYNFAPGPLGYWKMDEGSSTSAFDSSTNGFTGTLTGSPSWANGKFGKSVLLNGSSQYVSIGQNSSGSLFNFTTGDFTLEAWIKIATLNQNERVIERGTGTGASGTGYAFIVSATGAVSFSTFQASSAVQTTNTATSTITTGSWYHVAVSRIGASASLYVNGKYSNNTSATHIDPASASSNLNIGSNSAAGALAMLNGNIDEVKIYNYARNQAQVIADMNADHPAPGSPIGTPVSFWKFDEGYSTTAYDSGINANDLTLSSASWTNSGKFGKAWNGEGTKYLSRADDNDLDFIASEDFSISLWFKSDSASNPGAIEYLVDKSLSGGTQSAGYAIYAKTSGLVCFGVDDDTTWTPDDEACSANDIYDNTWHYITAKKTGTSRIDLYVDGLSSGSDTSIAATGSLANARIFYVGDRDGTDNGDEFNGDIDELKVYRLGLTDSQIKLDMNRSQAQVLGATSDTTSGNQAQSQASEYCVPGDSTSCAGPIAEWKFEEGGTTAPKDTSGNGFDGTWNGTASPNFVPGKYGKAGNFNGSDAYVSVTDNATLRFGTGDFTVSFWLQFPFGGSATAQTYSGIVVKGQTTAGVANTWGITRSSTTNRIVYSETGDSAGVFTLQVTSPAATAPSSGWHHIAVTRISNAVTMYQDGVNVATGTSSANLSSTSDLRLGADFSGTTRYLQSSLDGVRMFNYGRSQAQIAWDYNKGGPVGWWKMDECQGTTVNDASGNSNNGTLTIGSSGTTTIGTCDSSSSMWGGASGNSTTNPGKYNYAPTFDGTDDKTTVTDPSSGVLDFGSNNFSYGIWVKLDSSNVASSGFQIPIYKGGTSATVAGYDIELSMSINNILAHISDGSGSNYVSTGTYLKNLRDDTWHHLFATVDRSNSLITLYLDGIKRTTGAIAGGLGSVSNSTDLNFSKTSQLIQGKLDNPQIYNYALTAAQVKSIYQNGAVFFGPSSGTP